MLIPRVTIYLDGESSNFSNLGFKLKREKKILRDVNWISDAPTIADTLDRDKEIPEFSLPNYQTKTKIIGMTRNVQIRCLAVNYFLCVESARA